MKWIIDILSPIILMCVIALIVALMLREDGENTAAIQRMTATVDSLSTVVAAHDSIINIDFAVWHHDPKGTKRARELQKKEEKP